MITLIRTLLVAAMVSTTSLSQLRATETTSKAAKPAVKAKATDKVDVTWQNDPTCQFVFFAVLEGLYTDGVQDEIVELIVAPDDPDVRERSGVEHCFVFKCELCHAVYEAFVLYKNRQPFANAKGKTTFGKGADQKILEDLKSTDSQPRVFAMGSLIRPWIQRRIAQQRMTVDEQKDLAKRIAKYAIEGRELLVEHRRDKETVYVDWNFYGSCQACEAVEDIFGNLQRSIK